MHSAYLCFKPSENKDGMKVDVELENIVFGPETASTSFHTFFFNSSISGTHSCTNIASLTVSAKVVLPVQMKNL